jgi:hypothetical protein
MTQPHVESIVFCQRLTIAEDGERTLHGHTTTVAVPMPDANTVSWFPMCVYVIVSNTADDTQFAVTFGHVDEGSPQLQLIHGKLGRSAPGHPTELILDDLQLPVMKAGLHRLRVKLGGDVAGYATLVVLPPGSQDPRVLTRRETPP